MRAKIKFPTDAAHFPLPTVHFPLPTAREKPSIIEFSPWFTYCWIPFRGEEDPKKRQKRSNQGIAESILTKDQLYEMFTIVLEIKKFEHQLIFNAAQVIGNKSAKNYFNEML